MRNALLRMLTAAPVAVLVLTTCVPLAGAQAPGPAPGLERDHPPPAKSGSDGEPQDDAMPGTPQQKAKVLESLYAHLATADSAESAMPVAGAIERLWLHAGSDTIHVLMERAIKEAGDKRHDLALKLLDAVVELAPDYAEGWNRRALVHYLRNDYTRAMGDLRRVLALEPNHFKALDGMAQILRETGEKKAALKALQQLVKVHPFWPGATQAIGELARDVDGQGI